MPSGSPEPGRLSRARSTRLQAFGVLTGSWGAFRSVGPGARAVIITRLLRSVGQGALLTTLALYLSALGWSGLAIGALLTGGGLFNTAVSLGAGVTSDRTRRKPFLVAIEGLYLVAGVVAALTTAPILLVPAAVLGGFGRGQGGVPGPFASTASAWLAAETPVGERQRIYGLAAAVGFFGLGLGALVAAATAPLVHAFGAAGYRPLFGLVAVLSAACGMIMLRAPEAPRQPTAQPRRQLPAPGAARPRRLAAGSTAGFIFRYSLTNILNGVAVGLVGPLAAYWFALKFHVGSGQIGLLFGITFFVTAASSLIQGEVGTRVGMVRMVVRARLVGLVLLLAIPFSPFFWMAALFYVARSAVNRGTMGPRSALVVAAVPDRRRATALSISGGAMQISGAAGPTVAGALFDSGQLDLPFLVAVVLQGAYVALFHAFFAKYDQIEDGPGYPSQPRSNLPADLVEATEPMVAPVNGPRTL